MVVVPEITYPTADLTLCHPTIRPARIWAVNQPEDLVEAFILPGTVCKATTEPVVSAHVPWNPVSLAYWPSGDQVLVVCRGTWGITHLSAEDGSIVGHTSFLPGDLSGQVGNEGHGAMAEPGDIVVDDATGMAFVSCSAVDSVIQVRLSDGVVVRRFAHRAGNAIIDADFRCKNPLYLSLSEASGGDARAVYVAPLRSGNNTSLVNGSETAITNTGTIDDPSVGNLDDLPDEDLFKITPWTSSSATGSVSHVTNRTGLGALLFAHDTHPVTGDFWALTNDLFNGGPSNASEPLVRGRFAVNNLVRIAGGANGTAVNVHTLEDTALGSARGVGQPSGLSFSSATKRAYVTGMLSDNVLELNSDGSFHREWDLPEGAIPRGVLVYRVGRRDQVIVYCWGSNTMLQFNTAGTGTPALIRTYNLTPDSSPLAFKNGREIFFDGHRSVTGTLSCATCHVDGGADGLAWDLSPIPLQSKGAMVTQTLVGIEKVGPFHWRAERELADFRPGFDDLLGGHFLASELDEPTVEEFADLQEFIFSIKSTANPAQSRTRVIDSTIRRYSDTRFGSGNTVVGDAVVGQTLYHDIPSFFGGQFSCNDCHTAPTGSAGSSFPIAPLTLSPALSNIKPAPLHELWRKDQPLFKDVMGGVEQPLLGFGFSHGGVSKDIPDFLGFVEGGLPTGTGFTPKQVRIHAAEFVNQWDQGIAPAAHFAFFVDAASAASGSAAANCRNYLAAQSVLTKRNCDVVVIGKTLIGTELVERRWWRNPRDGDGQEYKCEDTSVPDRTTLEFLTAAVDDGETHLFVGYPPSMGERIGIDRDLDGTTDFEEPAGGVYDSTLPGITGAPAPSVVTPLAVVWTNESHARLSVEASAPARIVKVEYGEVVSPGVCVFTDSLEPPLTYSREHTPLLTGLRPSTRAIPIGTMDPNTSIAAETVRYGAIVRFETVDGQTFDSACIEFDMPEFVVSGTPLPDPSGGVVDSRKYQFDAVVRTQHKIKASEVSRVGTSGADFVVGVTVDYVEGDMPTALTSDISVVGHVVIKRASGTLELLDSAALVTPGAGTDDFEEFHTQHSGQSSSAPVTTIPLSLEYPNPPRYLVATALTDGALGASGYDVDLAFTVVPALATGDKVIFVVDGLFSTDGTQWTAALNGIGTSSPNRLVVPIKDWVMATENGFFMGQWHFPAGGESLAFPHFEMP